MEIKVQSGISRPGPAPASGGEKYPTSKLAVGEFFVVPKAQMRPGEEKSKFRNRVHQAVRTYKQRVNKDAHLQPGYDEAAYVPVEFSVILLGEPPEDHPDAWEPGDVGVWRDA